MNDKVDPVVAKQKVWLEEIVGRIQLSEKNQEQLKSRGEGMELIESLNTEKGAIREKLLGIKVEMKGGVFGGKKLSILDKGGDYQNEVDLEHHVRKMKEGLSKDQLDIVTAEVEKIIKIETALKGNPYYDPGPPDYPDLQLHDLSGKTEEDRAKLTLENAKKEKEHQALVDAYEKRKAECQQHMADDLWTPLVREGVIPETFVPKEYSEISKLFANASAAYEERLQEYSESMSEKDLLNEKFQTGFKIGKATLKLLTAGAGLSDAIGAVKGADQVVAMSKEVVEVLKYLDTVMTISEEITKVALTERDFTSVGGVLVQAISSSLGAAGIDTTASKVIIACASNAVKAVSVGKQLKEGDYEGAMMALIGAVASELGNFDPQGSGGIMTLVGKQLEANAGRAVKGAKLALMAATEPPPSPNEIIAAMMDIADDLVKSALKGKGDDDEDEDGGGEDSTAGVDFREAQATINAKFTQKDLDALREAEKEADAKMAMKIVQSAQETAEKEKALFEAHLRKGFPAPMSDDDEINLSELDRLQSIEYIIAIQKKNEATFAMCRQIAETGMSILSQIFPPAALGQSCMMLAFAIKDTIEKTQELIIWVENVEDAMNAKSAQVDAMLNRRGLQGKQTMRAGIQVAIEASRVVAAALAMTPVAGAAPIVKASADVTEAAIELADLIYTEVQLAAAWKVYVKARDNPDDRYLARKATRENPTLSKYAMAYGSLNGDPIAVEGMRRCGLDKQVLANPGTNVHKVVTYLEGKYPDDPVLLRAEPPKKAWYPGTIELKAIGFMSFYRMGTTKAEPAVASSGDIGGITAGLGRLEEAEAAFTAELGRLEAEAKKVTKEAAKTAPVEIDKAVLNALTGALDRLQSQLGGYKAQTTEGKPHAEMAAYIDALAAKAKLRDLAVARLVDGKPWTALYKEAA